MQVTELINKQAEWSEEVKNYDAAAEMYIKVREGEGRMGGGGEAVNVHEDAGSKGERIRIGGR